MTETVSDDDKFPVPCSEDQERAEQLSNSVKHDLHINNTNDSRQSEDRTSATSVPMQNSSPCSYGDNSPCNANSNFSDNLNQENDDHDEPDDDESDYESLEEDDNADKWEDAATSQTEEREEEEDKKIIDDEKDEEGEEEEEIEEILSEAVKMDRRKEAQGFKEEGNTLFKDQKYEEAMECYTKAVKLCPRDFVKDRSIMFSNRAACKLRLDKPEQAIKDCSKALELHPHYLKALLRRAELYEKVEKLDEALVDYQKVVEMDPSQHSARAACMRLPDQIKERNEKMKEEMLGKLKDLGNMILKPFGLSTNNFQMNQDPNTGGYSINFKQNGS